VVFRLALRQTEGLIGSILQLLGLDLAVPDHSTLSRRAETGQILTSELTTSDVDDGSQVEPLLDRTSGPLASFIGDGAYDRAGIHATITKRPPEADVIVPPRSTAVPSEMAASTSTQRDRHLQSIADHGCMGWQKRSGYTRRALVESAIDRFKLVTGNTLRSRMDRRRAIEIAIAV